MLRSIPGLPLFSSFFCSRLLFRSRLFLPLIVFGLYQPCQADLLNNPLVKEVSQSLNINSGQAAGGIGSLLQMAGNNVSSREFKQLKQAIPDASTLIAKAPSLSANQAATSQNDFLGFNEESLMGSLAPIKSQFSALGMNSDLIMPMVNKILSYLKDNNSTAALTIFKSALPSGLTGDAAKSLLNTW
ncbi:DUF2780 domain-containing protein [Endozoicomonas lisbonensis]|uniref:DUF2780 domain-containing protein n=1 Tax=Endozoicomonas lisbonensis TaxID=3120522 RepID=A0ABV2SN09_9GAMM